MPPYSPATGLPNLIYNWRDYNIRYQVSGPNDANHVLLLVHGLFVNSDHWRKALTGLQQQQQQTVLLVEMILLERPIKKHVESMPLTYWEVAGHPNHLAWIHKP